MTQVRILPGVRDSSGMVGYPARSLVVRVSAECIRLPRARGVPTHPEKGCKAGMVGGQLTRRTVQDVGACFNLDASVVLPSNPDSGLALPRSKRHG